MTTDGAVRPDFGDEVVAGACLTHDGTIRHEPSALAVEAASKPASPKKGAN